MQITLSGWITKKILYYSPNKKKRFKHKIIVMSCQQKFVSMLLR